MDLAICKVANPLLHLTLLSNKILENIFKKSGSTRASQHDWLDTFATETLPCTGTSSQSTLAEWIFASTPDPHSLQQPVCQCLALTNSPSNRWCPLGPCLATEIAHGRAGCVLFLAGWRGVEASYLLQSSEFKSWLQAIGGVQQAPQIAPTFGMNSHPQPGGMQQMPGQMGAAAAAPAASPAALAMSAGMSPAALSPQVPCSLLPFPLASTCTFISYLAGHRLEAEPGVDHDSCRRSCG